MHRGRFLQRKKTLIQSVAAPTYTADEDPVMARKNDDFTSYLDFAQRAAAPMTRLNELAVRNVERVARLQYDMAGDWMQFALAQMHAAVEAKDVGGLLSRQAEVAGAFVERLSGRQRDLARLSTDAQADAARWFDETSAA
jgi:phasin family protein